MILNEYVKKNVVCLSRDWRLFLILLIFLSEHDICLLHLLHMFVLMLNVSVMFRQFPVFLGLTSTKKRIKRLAQGQKTVPPVRLLFPTL